MLALSIRQPYAELILRGIKTAELRRMSTNIIGQRFYIYAPKVKAVAPVWSNDLDVAQPPSWMLELARQVKLIEPDADLPTGLLVGTAVIEKVEAPSDASAVASTIFMWHLADVQRLKHPIKPSGHPQPVWWHND